MDILRKMIFRLLIGVLLSALALAQPALARSHGSNTNTAPVIVNFNGAGFTIQDQIGHWDINGNYVSASSGSLLQIGSTFYRYGDYQACGFMAGSSSPYCGEAVYTSPDLQNDKWTYQGLLFDPGTWQSKCGGGEGTYPGCYRPKVIYNAANNNYVLWLNAGLGVGAPSGYFVWTCSSPTGGATPATPGNCAAQTAPVVVSNGNTNGDENLFLDPATGNGYLIFKDITAGGYIKVVQLNSSFTAPTGSYVTIDGPNDEAPAMFATDSSHYFAVYGPNCGYCTGTNTDYATASSPLGIWTTQGSINSNSCGGQPSDVTVLNTFAGPQYLYQSDLWTGNANEALAARYYGLLQISGSTISAITCAASVTVNGIITSPAPIAVRADQSSQGKGYFQAWADIQNGSPFGRMQTFVPTNSGMLTNISLGLVAGAVEDTCTYPGACSPPNGNLTVKLTTVDGSNNPVSTLATVSIAAASLNWNVIQQTLTGLSATLTRGTTYAIVLCGTNTTGAYGVGLSTFGGAYPVGVERYSTDGCSTWTTESGRALLFSTYGP